MTTTTDHQNDKKWEELSTLFERYKKESDLLEELNEFLMENVFLLFSSVVQQQTDFDSSQDELTCWRQIASYSILLERIYSEDEEIVRRSTFEAFQPVLLLYLSTLKFDSETDVARLKRETNEHSFKILQYVTDKSIPKEISSVVLNSLASMYTHEFSLLSLDLSVRQYAIQECIILSIDFLRRAYLRIVPGKRYPFFRQSFPVILNRAGAVIKVPDALADPEQLQRLSKEKEQSDQQFSIHFTALSAMTVDFMSELNAIGEDKILDDAHLRRERDWLLFLCFQLLVKAFSSFELINTKQHEINSVMKAISASGFTFDKILQYADKHRAWITVKNQIELEDLEDRASHNDDSDDEPIPDFGENDEINNFVTWDFGGIGIFAYLLFANGVEKGMYANGLFSYAYIFQKCQPYIEKMLQASIPSLSITAKSLCRYFFDLLGNYSIEVKQDVKNKVSNVEKHFNFIQAFINFMASCPDNKERTDAFNLLNDFISKFHDDIRYELLTHTLQTCPYPSLLGLMMHRLKEEMRLEYDSMLHQISKVVNSASTYKPAQPLPVEEANRLLRSRKEAEELSAPPMVQMNTETARMLRTMGKNSQAFLQKGKVLNILLDVLPRYVEDPDIDSLDVTLHGLNLIYFLLLRDSKANISGIQDSEIQDKLTLKILEPLTSTVKTAEQHVEKQLKVLQGSVAMSDDGDSDVDTDELDLDEILADGDSDLTDEDIEMLKELQQERSRKQASVNPKMNFSGLPLDELLKLQSRLFMTTEVLTSVQHILNNTDSNKP